MNPQPPLWGLVLAGGRSSRMGRDKATLVHPDGRTLLRRCCDLLSEAGCESVAVSLRADQPIPAGCVDVEIVRDPDGVDLGPIGGMIAGMGLRPDVDWLVVACDLPRLDAATLSHLVASRRQEEDFLTYQSETDGLPEPLCAFYARGALAILENAVADDCRSLREILIRAQCRMLEPVTRGALSNANTPAEWDAASRAGSSPDWTAELLEIWISDGNDFRGRHQIGRLHHATRRVPEVECLAGMGLRGDRYFGFKPDYKGQVTFFDAETLLAVRNRFALPDLSASVFRRNLVVRGVRLGDWVGKRFRFQDIEFEGSEECKPCYWMDQVAAPGAEDFLKTDFRGGLRARILSDGILRAKSGGI